MKFMRNPKSGFTLLEILLVVGIIAILAGIVIVAINPARQLAQVRNTERKSDIKQIKSALEQYYIDEYTYTSAITTSIQEVCDTGTASTTPSEGYCDGLADLSFLVPTYITAVPSDSQATTTNGTGYNVLKDATGKIVIVAAQAELGAVIAIGTSTVAVPPEEEYTGTLGDGLVAHYKMNDADCTVVDDSAGNNDGTGTCTSVAGHVGSGALSFNGTSDYISTSPVMTVGASIPMSISAWVKVDNNSMTGDHRFVDQTQNYGDFSAVLYLRNGVPGFATTNAGVGGSDAMALSAINAGGWYHLVGIVDPNNGVQSLYVNGVYQSSNDIYIDGADQNNGFDIAGVLYDDGGGPTLQYPTSGIIDDVRIYNRVLEPAEITELAAGTEAE